MLDRRRQEVRTSLSYPDVYNKMPSRRQLGSSCEALFTFPEEFYPKNTEQQEEDPDKDQDWYKEKGLWDGYFRSPEALERGASFKEFLYNRPEKEIIVISSNAFIDTLVHNPFVNTDYLGSKSCVWKPTISGRIRLVSLFSSESKQEILEDEDYSEYLPFRLSDQSDLFRKWYAQPTM